MQLTGGLDVVAFEDDQDCRPDDWAEFTVLLMATTDFGS